MKKGIINVLITAILFVTLEPLSKLIAEDVNPYAITFWRFFVGAICFLPLAAVKIKKEKIRLGKKDILRMFLLGVLFIPVSMVPLQIAVKEAPSPSLIAIIFSSNSVFTILFSALLVKGEKFTKNKVIALALGVIGVALCADFKSGANLWSVALAIFSAMTFSLYTALGQKYKSNLGNIISTGGVFLFGSLVLLIVLLVAKVPVSFVPDVKNLGMMLFIGIFITGIGYWSYFAAIEKGGAIMASLAFFIKPVLTPFVTLLINGIKPDVKVFVAVMFIVAASYFATYYKKKA